MLNFLIDLKEGILISLRAIRVNKLRSVLTTLGIFIGIVAVTTMSTAIIGLEEAFLSSISSLGSDVLYVDKYEWFGGDDWHTYRNRKDITYDQYEMLREQLSSFEAMAPNKRTFGRTVKYKEKSTQTTIVFGSTEEFLQTGSALPDEGRFFNELEVRASRRVCIIGRDIAEALFPNEDPLNKLVKMNGVSLKVIGILEKQGSGFLGTFSLDGQVIMPLKVFERVFGFRRGRLRIDVKVADLNKIEETKEEIISIMRNIRKVPPGKPPDFAVNRQEVFKEVYDSTVGVIAIAGIVITTLALFVGAIGIMNIRWKRINKFIFLQNIKSKII